MPLREEIERTLVETKNGDGGEISAEFAFPSADSPLFAGHFPGEPVLPGVCLLQCVLAALSKAEGKSVSLASVSKARFHSAVFPGETVLLTGRASWNENGVTGKFAFTKRPGKDAQTERVASVALTTRVDTFN
jgi:3-hydroxymyristoyl/3-hydroxydecanoyl-(acyl carrier protein) dehydratase